MASSPRPPRRSATSGNDAVILGVDKDIAVTTPELADIVLTSVEKRMTQAVFDVISDLSSGGEFTIDAYIGTLENDGTALSDFDDFDDEVSDEIKAKLEELKAGIIDGSIDPLATPYAADLAIGTCDAPGRIIAPAHRRFRRASLPAGWIHDETRAPRHHQAVRHARRQRRHRAHRRARSRSTPCSARTAPASRR